MRGLAGLLLALLAPLCRAGVYREIVDPPPTSIPAGRTPAEVESIIEGAARGRRWEVVEKKAGTLMLRLGRGDEWALVSAEYGNGRVSLHYADSKGMLDDDPELPPGTMRIHRNYIRWVANLAGDIAAALHPELQHR